eukprot:TRINITY_DN13007_c0_g1_i1.p4 TRINITY_DN13007_c0_g1~~TRINITY_DN13007_c0_g1_i1.p4  ORF type:complete len:92 (+),score=15.13 TRINITY_DN13007_c0_g1_i1:208-483(+)
MKGNLIKEQTLRDMDPVAAGLMARQYDEIVGIKIAHYISPNYLPHELGIEAATIGGVPVIVHYGPDPLSLEYSFVGLFSDPGYILYTYVFS